MTTREEQIQKAAERYMKNIITPLPASIKTAFIKGAEWVVILVSQCETNHELEEISHELRMLQYK